MSSYLPKLAINLVVGLLFLALAQTKASHLRLEVIARTSQFDDPIHKVRDFTGASDVFIPAELPLIAHDKWKSREAYALASISYLEAKAWAKKSRLNVTDATSSCLNAQITFIDSEHFRALLGDQDRLPLNIEFEYESTVFIPEPVEFAEQASVSSYADITAYSYNYVATKRGRNILFKTWLDHEATHIQDELFEKYGFGFDTLPIVISPKAMTVTISASASSHAFSWVNRPEAKRAYCFTKVKLGDIYLPNGQQPYLDYTYDQNIPPTFWDNQRRAFLETLIESMREALDLSNELTTAQMAAGMATLNPELLAASILEAIVGYGLQKCVDYLERISQPPHPFDRMALPSTQMAQPFYSSFNVVLATNTNGDTNDNSDPGYFVLADVNTVSFELSSLKEYEPEDAVLAQENLNLKLEFASTLQAMVTTLQRRITALDANDTESAHRQEMHVVYLVSRLRLISAEIMSVHDQTELFFGKYSLFSQKINEADVESYQQDLLISGLPQIQREILDLFGITEVDMQNHLRSLALADISGTLPIDIASIYSQDLTYRVCHSFLEPLIGDVNATQGGNDPNIPDAIISM